MKFKIGDKVRCIDDRFKGGIPVTCMPVYQGIYTWDGYSETAPGKQGTCGYLKEIPRIQETVSGKRRMDTSFSDEFFEKATERNVETFVTSKKELEKSLNLN